MDGILDTSIRKIGQHGRPGTSVPGLSGAVSCDLLAVYGTLRRRSIFHKLPGAASRLQFFSHGLIRGRLVWQRTFPGLIPGPAIAEVELFYVVDPNVLRSLDLYEGFDPINPAASLFIRRQVLLRNPRVWAWAYFLNRNIRFGTTLPSYQLANPLRQAQKRGLLRGM